MQDVPARRLLHRLARGELLEADGAGPGLLMWTISYSTGRGVIFQHDCLPTLVSFQFCKLPRICFKRSGNFWKYIISGNYLGHIFSFFESEYVVDIHNRVFDFGLIISGNSGKIR